MATLVKGMPRNRFETTVVISRELNFSRSSLGSALRTAPRMVSGPSRPRTVVLVTPREIEIVPFRFLDFSSESISIEILGHSPAGQKRFTLERQAGRQEGVVSDENGSVGVVG